MTRSLGVAAIALATIAAALPLQPPGCNQTAHYALVQSLAHGTPRIDPFRALTCDVARNGGHWYAAKAPGLALWTVPWYGVLRVAGVVPRDRALGQGFPQAMLELPRRALWQAGLWGAVVPFAALLLVLRRVVEQLEPGVGWFVAASTGLGTLLLPFATVFFSHLLATALGFAAFAVLVLRGPPLAAGVLAGLAVTADFPLALLAAGTAAYAAVEAPRLLRLAQFAIGGAAGLLPLLAVDWWAFGSPFHLSYASAAENQGGFFGLGNPSGHAFVEVLVGPRGLLTLSPLLAGGAAGLVLLHRGGRRAEALTASGVTLAYVLYDCAYWLPLGGYVPGPRFLIPAIPLLALGLGPLTRRLPLTTLLLAAISVGTMVVATAAEPLLGSDDTLLWLRRFRDGSFTETVLTLAGAGTGWPAILPFLAAAAAATVLAAVSLPLRLERRDAMTALAALAGWSVVLLSTPDMLRTDVAQGQWTGMLAAAALAAAVALAVARLRPLALLVTAPLLLAGFSAHTKHALAVAALALVLAATGGTGAFPSLRRGRS